MVKFTKKIRDSGSGSLEVTIPSDIRELLDLKDGDTCEFDIKLARKEK